MYWNITLRFLLIIIWTDAFFFILINQKIIKSIFLCFYDSGETFRNHRGMKMNQTIIYCCIIIVSGKYFIFYYVHTFKVNRSSDRSCIWGLIHMKNHLISSGCPRPSIALQCWSNCGLREFAFIHSFIHLIAFSCNYSIEQD